jgi:transcriptional regulator with XRE-family HTH domain
MKDRIKEFIDYKGISAGELADMLDVQRSNISHILNGRNKPGAVFLERFLLTFSEIDARWLLTGKGNMISSKNNASSNTNNTVENSERVSKSTLPIPNDLARNDEVEKIILLYTDGSFTSYIPK